MSVLGNPIVLSGGRGGGGLDFNKALIHVVATIGATVNFSTGGAVVKSIGPNEAFPKSTGGVADYYYSAANGTWSITATNGTISTGGTVSVTEKREYDIELCYGYWLHRVGTGLMSGVSVTWSSGTTGNVANANEISTTQTGDFCCGVIKPAVSLGSYSMCYFEYVKELEGNMASERYSPIVTGRYGFGNATAGDYNTDPGFVTNIRPDPIGTWTATSISLDGLSSSSYFKFCNWNNGLMGVRNIYFL